MGSHGYSFFFLSREYIALDKFKSFIDFLKFLECPYINYLQCGKDGHIDYPSSTSANKFLRVLSDMIDSSITQKVHESPVVTVLTDESMDIVVHQSLLRQVRFF